jgi:hypothetical protein
MGPLQYMHSMLYAITSLINIDNTQILPRYVGR